MDIVPVGTTVGKMEYPLSRTLVIGAISPPVEIPWLGSADAVISACVAEAAVSVAVCSVVAEVTVFSPMTSDWGGADSAVPVLVIPSGRPWKVAVGAAGFILVSPPFCVASAVPVEDPVKFVEAVLWGGTASSGKTAENSLVITAGGGSEVVRTSGLTTVVPCSPVTAATGSWLKASPTLVVDMGTSRIKVKVVVSVTVFSMTEAWTSVSPTGAARTNDREAASALKTEKSTWGCMIRNGAEGFRKCRRER
jgi:hypothetical protein